MAWWFTFLLSKYHITTISDTTETAQEFCPSCGEFVDQLTDEGWCGACSEESPTPSTRLRSKNKHVRLSRWLTLNADVIEDTMLRDSITASEAITLVEIETPTAVCACCGSFIQHVRHDNFFCNKTVLCKKARRYYKYLVHEKNKDKEEAFQLTKVKFKEE